MEKVTKYKAAACQIAPVFLDRDATVEKVCGFIGEAASNGAKVIAFPEALIPGYPWWIWLGDPFVYGMKFYRQLYDNAVEIPGKSVRKLSRCARKNDVYVCVSVTEKDGGSLYLTQLWFSPSGDLIGKHRKLKATGAEKTIWGDGDGSMMPVFETEYGNLGGLQCWEHMLPLNIAAMGSMNEQVHVSSWPAFLPQPDALFRQEPCETCAKYYTVANQTFTLMASQIYTQEMQDMLCENDTQRMILAVGGGCTKIFAPSLQVISGEIPADEEGIAYADIDLSLIPVGKYLVDPAGHYSTPGFLRLTFDRSEHFPVMVQGEAACHFIGYDQLQASAECSCGTR